MHSKSLHAIATITTSGLAIFANRGRESFDARSDERTANRPGSWTTLRESHLGEGLPCLSRILCHEYGVVGMPNSHRLSS